MAERNDPLREIGEAETAAHLRRASILYLECAISLMMVSMPVAEVIEILQGEADDLTEYE